MTPMEKDPGEVMPTVGAEVDELDEIDDDEIDEVGEKIEEAIEEKHDAVIAADATGLLRNEEFITRAELSEGGVTPPA
jgi:hypothetical protein